MTELDDMQVTVEAAQGLERRLRVEIPEERVRSEIDKRLGDLARNVRIPGFRPGKAPAKVVARRYGRQVREEVVGGIVQESLRDAISQQQLRPAIAPRIAPLESSVGAGVRYTATFDVFPEITLPQFESIEVVRPVATVEDEDVDRRLEVLRIQRRVWKTVDRAASRSDRVVVDIEGIVEGRSLDEASATQVPVELDAGRMVDGFEDGLVGVRGGEGRTLDLTFPDSYPKHIAGKPVAFRVKVHRVEESYLPDIDDAFAESLGVEDGGVEKLRGNVRAGMDRELADELDAILKRHVADALLAASEIELPESLVREEVARATERRRDELRSSGIDPQRVELRPAEFEERIRRRMRLDLLFAEVVRVHRIEIDHSRVRARVAAFASTYEDPARVTEWYYADRQRLSGIESLVLEDQIGEWILERIRVREERTSFDRIRNPGQTSVTST